MPLTHGNDKKGPFWIGGNHKYYYKPGCVRCEKAAKEKAIRQGIAIGYSIRREHPCFPVGCYIDPDDSKCKGYRQYI